MTRPRLIVLSVIGIALLYMLGNWIASNTEWVEHTLPMPPKGEAARSPFYPAQRFAEQLGATTSWDRIFAEPSQDAVIVLSTWQWSLSANRRLALQRWVENGGRLVVDSAIFGGVDQFEKWSGISWKYVIPQEGEDDKKGEEGQEVEAGKEGEEGKKAEDATEGEDAPEAEAAQEAKDASEGEDASEPEDAPKHADADEHEDEDADEVSSKACREATEERDGVPVTSQRALNKRFCTGGGFGMLVTSKPVLWGLRDERGLQVMRVKVGRGSVTVINGTPFRSRAFFDGDHPWLLVAATQMTRGDEMHFLSQDDHPGLLAVAWMRGWPVIITSGLLIALLLWRGAMRFGPLEAPPTLARRSLAEQIRGTGEFVVRGGGAPALHAAMVRALEEAVRKNVKGYGGLTGEARTAALAAAVGSRGRAEALAAAMDDGAGTDVSDSRRTLAKIEAARRQVIGEDRKSSRKWGTRR
jgi:hypothetical protein